jgi:DNA-binding response OmpR family regulator
MPQTSGFDLANRLRDTHPQCKILLFTGEAGVDDLREYALELGHNIEVLSKPLHPLKLIERVKIISRDQISSGIRARLPDPEPSLIVWGAMED